MPSKLVPQNPAAVMSIRTLTPQITTLSLPFSRAGFIAIGGRATLVKLSTTGALAVFSPTALTPEVRQVITDMTSSSASPSDAVGYIIAPDMEHHIFLSEWKAAFPSAKIIGPEGLPEKRAKQASSGKSPNCKDDPFHFVFRSAMPSGSKVDADFDADFDTEFASTTPNKEIAFFHRPSKTLIEADLLFNLPPTEQYSKVPEAEKPHTGYTGIAKLGNLIFQSVGRTEGDMMWPRRFYWYLAGGKNRTALNESLRRMDVWDFENIIPCHGDIMMGDGKERFRRVFEWHLKAKGE